MAVIRRNRDIVIGESYYAVGKKVVPEKTWVTPPNGFNQVRGKRVWLCRVFELDGSVSTPATANLSLNDFSCTWQTRLNAVEARKAEQQKRDALAKQTNLRRDYLRRRLELAKDLFPRVADVTLESFHFKQVTLKIGFDVDILDAALETEQAEIADDLRSIMAWTKETNA